MKTMRFSTLLSVVTLVCLTIHSSSHLPCHAEWFKGNLHTHSQWSDGQPMPEWSIADYKERGYHFICPSDHNIIQTDDLNVCHLFGTNYTPADMSAFEGETSTWKPVLEKGGWARLTEDALKKYEEKFSADSLQTKVVDGVKFVRLKPFKELEAQFAEPGKFLLIPGYEQTGGTKDGTQLHMNFINVTKTFPYFSGEESVGTILQKTMEEGEKLYAGENYLFFLNHPLWRFYDVSPEVLIEQDAVRHFELTNNGLTYDPHPNGWSPELFWDVVNGARLSQGKQLLYAIGSDDRHGYSHGGGWMYVNADELTTDAIFAAIHRGDSYCSNGVELEDVSFDSETKTLRVKVKPEEGFDYRIEFIGVKKGFDAKHEVIQSDRKGDQPARQIDSYAKEISVVLKVVEGVEGECALGEDDLFIRARVLRSDSQFSPRGQLHRPAAWTQPYVSEQKP
ncbi:MAG: hypothetical protein Q4D38_04650 [Planctomycetia bacterium]|nr:hypothetical protein [Planctomycetia bacterium]